MEMTRRGFLQGIAGILAAAAAPAIITTPGLLMPVKKLWIPPAAQSMAMFNGRIWWISNDGLSTFTVSGLQLADRWEATPLPSIDVQPGQSLAFAEDTRVWSRYEPKVIEVDYKVLLRAGDGPAGTTG